MMLGQTQIKLMMMFSCPAHVQRAKLCVTFLEIYSHLIVSFLRQNVIGGLSEVKHRHIHCFYDQASKRSINSWKYHLTALREKESLRAVFLNLYETAAR